MLRTRYFIAILLLFLAACRTIKERPSYSDGGAEPAPIRGNGVAVEPEWGAGGILGETESSPAVPLLYRNGRGLSLRDASAENRLAREYGRFDGLNDPADSDAEEQLNGNAAPARPPALASALSFSTAALFPGITAVTPAELEEQIDAAVRMGAALILLPPGITLDGDGHLRLGEASCSFGPETFGVPVLLWEELIGSELGGAAMLADGAAGAVVFLKIPPEQTVPENAWRRFAHLVNDRYNPQGGVVVVCNRAPWEGRGSTVWGQIKEALGAGEDALVVGFADSETAFSELVDGIRCIGLPLNGAAMHGEMPLLWLSCHQDGPRASLVYPWMLADVQPLNRGALRDEQRLREALSVTPVRGPVPTTLVKLRNDTDRTLSFEAEWLFSGDAPPVSPEILGFELAPGDLFSQEFKFEPGGEQILKFSEPRLQLTTEFEDTDEPVLLQARPWCCMVGSIEPVSVRALVDGDPSEWAARGLPINHRTQLVSGDGAWEGPVDLSANLFLGRTEKALLVGGRIYDDALTELAVSSRATFAIRIEGRETAEEKGLLDVAIDDALEVRTTIEHPGFDIALREKDSTIEFEMLIPLELLPPPGSFLRFDAALSQTASTPDTVPVTLVFSGSDTDLTDQTRYASFRIPPMP